MEVRPNPITNKTLLLIHALLVQLILSSCSPVIRAHNNLSVSSPSLGALSLITPASPFSLSALAKPSGIALQWLSPAPMAGTAFTYNVMRGTSEGTETLLVSGLSATSYLDTTAVAGTTYSYTVVAVNGNSVTSTPSNEVFSGLPSRLGISGPGAFSVGVCSQAFSIFSGDGLGNMLSVPANLSVALSSGSSVQFYSDPTCSTVITTLNLTTAQPYSTFYAKDLAQESTLLEANTTGLAAATIAVTTISETANKLVLTGLATPAIATTGCSGSYTVNVEDINSNPTTVSTSTVITLAGKGSGSFYSNSTCATAITTTTLASGASAATFYFRDATAQSLLFSASATGLSSASLAVTMQPNTATKLTIAGPIANTTNGCEGPYTVTSVDASSNASPVSSPVQVNLSNTGAATFYTTGACAGAVTSISISAASSNNVFYTKDATAQTITLTAADNAAVLTSGTLSSVVTTATGIVITGPTTTTASTCSGPYTVTNTNGAGATVSSAASVALTTTGSALFYGAGCAGNITSVTWAAGVASFYVEDATSENLTLTATSSGVAKGTYSVVNGLPSPTTLTLTGAGSVAAGACSLTTITTKNAAGTTSPVAANTAVVFAGQGSGSFYTDVGCTALASSPQILSGQSTASYYFKDLTAETILLQAQASGYSSGSLVRIVSPASPTQLYFTGPIEIPNSTCSSAFTVEALDTYRNHSNVGSAVTISLTGNGNGQFYSDSGCTASVSSVVIANGTNKQILYFKDPAQEALTFQASDTSTGMGTTRTALLEITAPSSISTGSDYSCSTVSGALYCWGTFQLANLGVVSFTPQLNPWFQSGVTQVVESGQTSNYNATCVLINGGVQCWADSTFASNAYGQLGNNTTVGTMTPVQVQGLTSGVTQISGGMGNHLCAVQNGGLWCWGNNANEQLGLNSLEPYSTVPAQPSSLSSNVASVSTGLSHTCAIMSGSLYCWGLNNYGQVGNGASGGNVSTPTLVSGMVGAVSQVAAGGYHTCALTTAGAVYCWGNGGQGQIGNGSTANQSVPVLIVGGGATFVATGNYHTCATVSGGVQCWGLNSSGQLGNGNLAPSSVPTAVSGITSGATVLSLTSSSSCALVEGVPQCWGDNSYGEIGLDSVLESNIPLQVTSLTSGATQVSVGSGTACGVVNGGVSCWGGGILTLPPFAGGGLTSGVTQVINGYQSSCALMTTGGVQCWGINETGSLGNSSYTNTPTAVQVSGLTSGVSQISMGEDGTDVCALLTTGTVECWGNNASGQLGDGTTQNRPAPVQVMASAGIPLTGVTALSAGANTTCAVLNTGTTFCWGSNTNGQLGNGTTTASSYPIQVQSLPLNISSVAVGEDHTCALTSDGSQVYCWGGNTGAYGLARLWTSTGPLGQLGNSSESDSAVPVLVQGLQGTVTSISAGDGVSCAVLSNGQGQCWGNNCVGQLGIGSEEISSSTPQTVAGLTNISSLIAGQGNTCAVLTTGAIQCWGTNYANQLDPGAPFYSAVPVTVDLP